MFSILNKLILILIISTLSGCVSIKRLPDSANEVNFNDAIEGKTDWAQWQGVMNVKGIDRRTAYQAAKAGLADAKFTIQKASIDLGAVIGEHGMTAYDWNIIAGVYFRKTNDGYQFKAIVEGSKDVGFWGDTTKSSWVENIFKGIREYILTESLILESDRNIFN